ncbi:polyhydroxyalkanoate synthesis repressor PhaR [Paracoccaceae bacterium]|nr:polyhydroxyalkanoate synthesis repressor PhaR [Paracoccaceae bacterium]
MLSEDKPLLVKRYASRRLYNTETSDYVTLEDIAGFIQEGREVQIIDLKSGDDLTRQYLLQIIADHESRGDNVLPVNVLMDLVRSYTTNATSVVPEFLAMSFDMMRAGNTDFLQNMGEMKPIAQVPGLDAMTTQKEAFFKAMSHGFAGQSPAPEKLETKKCSPHNNDDLSEIKSQLVALQEKLNQLEQ